MNETGEEETLGGRKKWEGDKEKGLLWGGGVGLGLLLMNST